MARTISILICSWTVCVVVVGSENALQKLVVVAAGVTLVIFLVMVYNMVKKGTAKPSHRTTTLSRRPRFINPCRSIIRVRM